MKIHKIFICVISCLVLNVQAETSSSMAIFFQALKTCNKLEQPVEYAISPNTSIIISADPSGFCQLNTIHPPGATAPATYPQDNSNPASGAPTELQTFKCKLSEEDVAGMITPEALSKASQPDALTPADVKQLFGPILNCKKKTPLPVAVPAPPPGAVPAGSLLPLPAGVTTAPGEVPAGTPSGYIPTSANPVTTPPGVTTTTTTTTQPQ